MRIRAIDLEGFGDGPAPLPPVIEPRLTLAEEFALLSLSAPRRRAKRVARLLDDETAVRTLRERGLLAETGGLRRRPEATPAARVPARKARVVSIIRRAAPPIGP